MIDRMSMVEELNNSEGTENIQTIQTKKYHSK